MTRNWRVREELARLLARAQEGDQAAFEELYRCTAQAQYYLMAHRVGYEAAGDLLQELYLIAWRNIGKIKPGAILGYLGATGRNLCRRHLEQQQALTRGTAAEDAALERESIDTAGIIDGDDIVTRDQADDPAFIVGTEDESARLARALREELTDFERACIVMRYYQNAKIDEIAEALDTSRNTVKRTLSRALVTLRSKMGLLPFGGAVGLSGPLADAVEERLATGVHPRTGAPQRRSGLDIATGAVGLAAAGVTAGAVAFAVLAPVPMLPEADAEPVPIEEGAVPAASAIEGDVAAPVLLEVRVQDDSTVLRFSDESSVADVWCIGPDGSVYRPDSHEIESASSGTERASERSAWSFALPTGSYEAHAVDSAGNEARGEITVEIYPQEPEPSEVQLF